MKKNFFLPFLFVFLSMFGFALRASALTISPARIELSGDPGQTITGDFLVSNDEDGKTFYSSTENFQADGESGTPSFVDTKEGLQTWINLAPSVTLAKGVNQKIPFTITIPKDADPGGHFAAIFLSTVPPNAGGGQVSVGAKIGMLVLLRVSGDIKEGGGILGFDTSSKGSFFSTLPVDFIYRFNNSGNDRVNPLGNVLISNTLGMETANIQANPTQGNVLPGSTRRFEVLWGGDAAPSGFFSAVGYEWSHFAFGKYSAALHLTYGNSSIADAQKTIFIFPWQLLLVILIIFIVIFLALTQGLKRYNRWIIQKASEMQK